MKKMDAVRPKELVGTVAVGQLPLMETALGVLKQ